MPLPNRSKQVPDPFNKLPAALPPPPKELEGWTPALERWYDDLRQAIEANQKVLLAKIEELS